MKCSTLNNSDIMKKIALLLNVLLVATICVAQKQTYKFDFSSDKKVKEGLRLRLCLTMNKAMGMICNPHGMAKVTNLSSFR